jgi:hypothetical protein
MPKRQETVVEIISELSRIQALPQPYKDEDDDFPFPRQLGVGNGRFISRKVDQLISDVARAMRNSSSLKSQFTADDYRKLVRRAFGPALAEIDLDADPTHNSRSVLADVEAKVAEDVDRILNNGRQEHAFGCTLFVYKNIEPFDIGPVRFEPREVWLERKASDGRSARVGSGGRIERFDHQIADGPISGIAKRRILRAWRGQKLRARKSSVDGSYERDIIDAIGDCPYVCSVKIPGFGGKARQDKALLAARLALTTISLIWENSSKALDGLNLLFDREMRSQSLLSFTSDGLILGGRRKSNMPHAPWVKRDELEKHFQGLPGEFTVAGEAIEWLLNPTANHNRAELLNVITQAMLWFHDGCREVTDLKAIVSFASCMEILAGGGGRESIRKLIRARLGIDENAKIHRDGFTVKDVIDQIYDEGRTRFIHGPRRNGKHVWGDKLGHDWSETRGLAEWIARRCLVCCMALAANTPAPDDPKQLLK